MSNDDSLSERMALALSKALVRRIDDWRRKQPSIPTRAAAARQLIEAALGDETNAGRRGQTRSRRGQAAG
jgi:hypothetical protein